MFKLYPAVMPSLLRGKTSVRTMSSLMRFGPVKGLVEVEHSSRDFFPTQVLTDYPESHSFMDDHRPNFKLAPSIAVLLLVIFMLPAFTVPLNGTIPFALWAFLGIGVAITLRTYIYTIRSIHYVREHYDELVKEYYRPIADLSRFVSTITII